MRKLVGLAESTDRRVAAVGQRLHTTFADLQEATYTLCEGRAFRRTRWRAPTRQRSRHSGKLWNGIAIIRTRSCVQ